MKPDQSEAVFKTLFENARKAEPVMELKEIDALIQKAELAGSGKKASLSSTQIILIMTSLISLILATVFLFPAAHQREPVTVPSLERRSQPAPESRINPVPETVPFSKTKALPRKTKATLPLIAAIPAPLRDTAQVTQKLNINGINLLLLEDDAHRKLGILAGMDGISVPMGNGRDPHRPVFTKGGTLIGNVKPLGGAGHQSIKPLGSFPKALEDSITARELDNNFPIPRLITDDLGLNWRAYSVKDGKEDFTKQDRHKEIQAMISTLIPVLVRTGDVYTKEDSLAKRWRPDLIIWYEPTEEFLKLLPAVTAAEIRKEKDVLLEALQKHNASDSAKNTGSNEPFTCKYFETCKSDRSLVSGFVAYPNPTREKITVAVELRVARNLSFYVSDISGKIVLPLQDPQFQPAGKEHYEFDLSSLPKGIYLFTVITDRNERYTERIIKE